MKICIPTKTDEGRQARVYEHFGSAPYFTIYDTDSDSVEVISNSDQHHSHGMCQPMSAIAGKSIDVMVTGGAGLRVIQRLNEDGIKVFRAVPGTVSDIAARYAEGGLAELTADHACQHHHGCH